MLIDAQNLEDLLSMRAKIRELRQEMLNRRLALREVKTALATALDGMEDALTEIEQRQGRLPFDEAEATEVTPPAAGSNGQKKRWRQSQPRGRA